MLTKKYIIAGIGASGIFICLIPLILGWKFNYGVHDIQENSPIIKSMNSVEFGYSLVCYISILLPLTVEILCDIFSHLFFSINLSNILSGVLILILLTTNLIVLCIAIPTNHPGLLVIMFQIRNVICTCTAYSKILEVGSDAFKIKSVLFLTLSAIGISSINVFTQFTFDSATIGVLGTLTSVIGFIYIICFLYNSLVWINVIRKVAYKNITNYQYICSVYLFMMFYTVLGFTFLSSYYNADIGATTNTTYLTSYNYISATFIITLSVVHVRMNKREKEVAQETLEEKRMFVRFVSHEIRTPLNTVFLGLKVLRDEINNNYSKAHLLETLEEVQQSCDTSLTILNDMLFFEKIESGRMVLEKEELNPKVLLEYAVTPFSIQARNLGISLTLSYSPNCEAELDRVFLLADKNKISQVIRNLVSNSLKFTNPGGTVKVFADIHLIEDIKKKKSIRNKSHGAICSSQYRKVLRVKVTDTGHGISKENIGKLFHQMIQFHAATQQSGGGTGLGLWISREIIEKHQGSITAYSEGEGCGSTFTVELQLQDIQLEQIRTVHSLVNESPLTQFGDERDKKEEKDSEPNNNNNNSLTSFRISSITPVVDFNMVGTPPPIVAAAASDHFFPCHTLVVDDSVSNRKMLVRLIRDNFLSIDEAKDGVEAVAKVKQALKDGTDSDRPHSQYDVLLMDYMMPNMDGPTAAKAIRELGFTGLIIGVTGNALQGDIHHFHASGANNVLTKPVDMSLLMKIISSHFVKSKLPSQRQEYK